MQHQTRTIINNIRTPAGTTANILIEDGRIAAISDAPSEEAAGRDGKVIDGRGRLAVPALVEGHIHLDKALLGLPLIPHRVGGSVMERVQAEKALRGQLELSIEQRGSLLVEQVLAFGTGLLRTHVDIDTEVGLAGLHEVLRIKEKYAARIDIQIVAFPQSGILRDPGTADLLDAALSDGADIIGGLDPASFDDDVAGHLNVVYSLAQRHGIPIDIHLHDAGPLGAFQMRQIAARTTAAGLEGRTVISHGYALGSLDAAEFGQTADMLAAAGISIMTNAPGAWAMPPVLELRARGVNVFAGSDNIRDTWWPYGNGDMLDRARMIGYRQGLFTNEQLEHAFAMSTENAARALGVSDYGLAVGRSADLVLIEAASVPEAVLAAPTGRLLVKAGVVAGGVI